MILVSISDSFLVSSYVRTGHIILRTKLVFRECTYVRTRKRNSNNPDRETSFGLGIVTGKEWHD